MSNFNPVMVDWLKDAIMDRIIYGDAGAFNKLQKEPIVKHILSGRDILSRVDGKEVKNEDDNRRGVGLL